MEQLTDLKPILHSKRANIYYLEKCRVMQKDGRVLYLTETKKDYCYWNIPIANTTCLLLGTGTSITQAAMRLLVKAGVCVGFCGGGATPLLAACEIEWLTPQSEYRPTEYLQGWMSFWFDDTKRLQAAKILQLARIDFIKSCWSKNQDLTEAGFYIDDQVIDSALTRAVTKIKSADNVTELLLSEAQLTKELYKYAIQKTKNPDFKRNYDGEDTANAFLNHGNYLAYGLAASCLWVLGISHGFAVMHGKTRRGALVFDVADLIKDALILPTAFICANNNFTEQQFRQKCLQIFIKYKAMDFMFEQVKQIALTKEWD